MYDQNLSMDWVSWLSKTGLDRSLVHDYGLILTRNELEAEDLKFFNHEFLQSMGISVAKHRLEILKLARKEVRDSPHRVLRLISAINKAKKSFTKRIGNWAFSRDWAHTTGPSLAPLRAHWTGALRKQSNSKEFNHEELMVTSRSTLTMRSGPLDRRLHDRSMVRSPAFPGAINKSPTMSGPLDQRVKERYLFANGSPDILWGSDLMDSSPEVKSHSFGKEKMVGDNGVQPLWSLMFQDMKPT